MKNKFSRSDLLFELSHAVAWQSQMAKKNRYYRSHPWLFTAAEKEDQEEVYRDACKAVKSLRNALRYAK